MIPQSNKKGSGDNSGGDIKSEHRLQRACQVTVCVIKAAQAACYPNITGLSTLEYINRCENGTVNNKKLFYSRQMGKSIKKYGNHQIGILCYIW